MASVLALQMLQAPRPPCRAVCLLSCRASRRWLHTAAYGQGSKRVVFLGTPEVATIPLEGLWAAAQQEAMDFELAAVVSQPARRKGRGAKAAQQSPVHARALELGMPAERILTPVKAREEDFLKQLEDLKPDLCVTAAYGNMLPQRFLDIPTFGTINIHPSLLPRWRGAAPVNRCLEAGDSETGVSLAFTVLACDAGPVVAQRAVQLAGDEQAPELLLGLMVQGTELLVESLPRVWSGEAAAGAAPQDEAAVTHAAKMDKGDAVLDFDRPAVELHNKVRGFAGWPGTVAQLRVWEEGKGDADLDLTVLRSRVGEDGGAAQEHAAPPQECKGLREVGVTRDALLLPCRDGSWLAATEVQAPGKKACPAAAFANGLSRKRLFIAQ